ncbi:MAG: hypothetical protein K2O91_11165 [Lachnospiraceae bacterium]|nr:hypothetical protein [Lachnospiraceae bacterium]
MHNYLVQKLINNEVYAKVYTETQLINFLDMSDCYDEEYRIYDISVFGEIREVLYKGWQPNRLIEIVDSNGNIVASGYGTDH